MRFRPDSGGDRVAVEQLKPDGHAKSGRPAIVIVPGNVAVVLRLLEFQSHGNSVGCLILALQSQSESVVFPTHNE